jgi:hypothetical protein
MRASRWWLSGLIVVAGAAFAGDPPQAPSQEQIAAQMCSNPQQPCQRDVRVVLKQADGTTFDRTYPVLPPILQEGFFAVLPGQTVYIEAELVDGQVRYLRAVDKNVAPEKTIVAKLEQNEHGMMLHTQNPFDATIKFDMGIMRLEGNHAGPLKTSSCPLIPKGASFELWSEALFQVLIGSGRVLEKSDTMVCS